jgi:hypothetical protein
MMFAFFRQHWYNVGAVLFVATDRPDWFLG